MGFIDFFRKKKDDKKVMHSNINDNVIVEGQLAVDKHLNVPAVEVRDNYVNVKQNIITELDEVKRIVGELDRKLMNLKSSDLIHVNIYLLNGLGDLMKGLEGVTKELLDSIISFKNNNIVNKINSIKERNTNSQLITALSNSSKTLDQIISVYDNNVKVYKQYVDVIVSNLDSISKISKENHRLDNNEYGNYIAVIKNAIGPLSAIKGTFDIESSDIESVLNTYENSNWVYK